MNAATRHEYSNEFVNAAHLRNFVGQIAYTLSCLGADGAHAALVDFGDDNLCRPPAISLGTGFAHQTTQPTLYFRFEKGRMTISGSWPHVDGDRAMGMPTDRDLVGVPHRITVDPRKPAGTIARDIANRLLPSYLPLHRELQRRIAVHFQDAQADRNIAERLSYGEHIRTKGDSLCFSVGLADSFEGAAWGDVTVAHGKVTIELRSLTEAQAAAVLKALGAAS